MRLEIASMAVLGLGLCLAACVAQPTANSAKNLAAEQDACIAAGHSRDSDAAIQHCTKVLQAAELEKPIRAKAFGIRGFGYADNKDCDHAILDFTESIALAPDRASPYAGRGWCYQKKGDLQQALQDLDQAVAVNSRYADGYASRGWLYLALNEPDKALEDFNNAVALDPEDAEAHRGLGRAQAKEGDYESALTSLNAVVRLKPQGSASFGDRGLVQLLRGQWEASVQDTSKAIALAPDSVVSYENRASAFFTGGDYRRAIADMEQAQRLDPGNPYPAVWLYMAHWRLGEAPDAALRDVKAGDDAWPAVVLRHYQGLASEPDVLSQVTQKKPGKTEQRDCELALFLGERDLFEGRRDAARQKLEHARDSCPRDQVERAVAIAELRRL